MPAKLRSRVIRGCRLALLLVAAAAAFGPATGHAFTLISGTTKMYVNPAVGYTTSYVQVRATFKFGTSCPPPPVSFRFTFDSKAFWTRSVSACNASTFLWDTGWSPYTKPPVTVSAGQHVIAVGVYSNTNVLFPGGTAQFAYTAVNPPPSPVARPSPTPSPTPSPVCAVGAATAGCPSPSTTACPAAMLPNAGSGGWGDSILAALMIGAALPIVGLAMFGPQTLFAAAYRRRRFLTLFGLSAMAVLALNCTFPTASNPQASPAAAVTPSSASTPSSCSA